VGRAEHMCSRAIRRPGNTGTMHRSWAAFVLSSIILIALCFANTFTASSAEIGCATLWSLAQNTRSENVEQILRQRFPSGRRPVLGTSCLTGLLRGTIQPGDDEKILNLYRANHPFLEAFILISPGGNVNAAISIGRLFRKYLIYALGPEGRERPSLNENGEIVDLCSGHECICASACALIWLGAVERYGEVGLHRPTTDDPTFKTLSAADASSVYRRALQSISTYLGEMEVPRPMIDAMVNTASSEIKWVDSDDNLRRPPSIAEWEDASCGSFTNEERKALYELSFKTTVQKNASPQEALFQKLLAEKFNKYNNCRLLLLDKQRDHLAPP
jgi:hypothetical protein